MREAGNPASYTRSVGGVTTEKKWAPNEKLVHDSVTTVNDDGIHAVASDYDRRTGALRTYKADSTTGMGTAEFEFDYVNVASAKISAGTSAKFAMDISANVSIAVNVSANIGMAFNTFDLDLKGHILAIEMSLNSMETEVKFLGGSVKYGSGIKFEKKPEVDIEAQVLELKTQQAALSNTQAVIATNVIHLMA